MWTVQVGSLVGSYPYASVLCSVQAENVVGGEAGKAVAGVSKQCETVFRITPAHQSPVPAYPDIPLPVGYPTGCFERDGVAMNELFLMRVVALYGSSGGGKQAAVRSLGKKSGLQCDALVRPGGAGYSLMRFLGKYDALQGSSSNP